MKKWFFKEDRNQETANELYIAAVTQARQPKFYLELGVPDTVDGRFDLIILHVYLLLRSLNKLAQIRRDLWQYWRNVTILIRRYVLFNAFNFIILRLAQRRFYIDDLIVVYVR